MSSTVVQYKSAHGETTKGPSPIIWADCPIVQMLVDPSVGYYFFDDFLNVPVTPPTTQGNFGSYKAYSSTGGTILDGDTLGGAIAITDATDNEGVAIGMTVQPFQISSLLGKLWFECRIKSDTIADTKSGIFVGLIDASTLSATVPIAADGTLADENLVGFHRLEGDGDKLDTVYKANGVTQVTVQADAVTLVANTYVKVGFVFEPDVNKGGPLLTFFADGVKLATTKVIPDNTGTDFPADVKLGLVLAHLAAAASGGSTTIDWWGVAQLRQ